MDLQNMTADALEQRVGQNFTLATDDQAIELALVEVKRLGTGQREGGAFSALFAGPLAPVLAQGIHELKADAGEAVALFLVPVGQDETSSHYEAVFN